MKRQLSKGFTIIELLVVVSIIALLVGILLPAIGKARDNARVTVSKSNLRQLSVAHQTYAADWADRQMTLQRDNLGQYAGDVELYNDEIYGSGAIITGFEVHPKLVDLLERRRKVVAESGPIDWAMGEALAFGSLLVEGTPVRLSGQDSSRGTFSHRHAVFVDQKSGEEYAPLDHLTATQARFEVYDSLLSEAAVLGFEYGYSLADPTTLTIWEAQFGDFTNGALVMNWSMITCAHSKWQRMSGLVMLLPHGYDGQDRSIRAHGPSASSSSAPRTISRW